MRPQIYIDGWPDSYQERVYKIFEPANAYNNTESFLDDNGFQELTRSAITIEKDSLINDLRKQELNLLYLTIVQNGLVLLTYSPQFTERFREIAHPHIEPMHLEVCIAGSSRALDDVVQRLSRNARLMKQR